MVTPVLGPSSSAACSDQAAVLLKHLESALDGIMEEHQARSHLAWGLASHISEALKLLTDNEGTLPIPSGLKGAAVDLLEQLAGGLMMAGHHGS